MSDCIRHDFYLAHAEASFGSSFVDIDVSVCRRCGATARHKKGPVMEAAAVSNPVEGSPRQ